jgi:hypothetical protein
LHFPVCKTHGIVVKILYGRTCFMLLKIALTLMEILCESVIGNGREVEGTRSIENA